MELVLFTKLKSKLQTQILLGDIEQVGVLVRNNHTFDASCMHLAVLNNRYDIIQYVQYYQASMDLVALPLCPSLLNPCALYGYTTLYLTLINSGLRPNLSVYNAAAQGPSITIIADVNESIGLTEQIVKDTVKANHTDVVRFIITEALKMSVRIEPNLVCYPLMNNNMELVSLFEEHQLFEWHIQLYYAALLSGSIDIVSYAESKLDPDLHEARDLDTSRTSKGCNSLLLGDIVYTRNHKKYFAHTMNYAIQSGSIEVLDYIYARDYGLTTSNVITAITQGSIEVFEWVLLRFDRALPYFLLAYFSLQSHIPHKYAKAALLLANPHFNRTTTPTLQTIRKYTLHTELISNRKSIEEDCIYDLDYTMGYASFFQPQPAARTLTTLRCLLATDIHTELAITIPQLNTADKQALTDMLFLCGTQTQIRELYPYLAPRTPRVPVLMETLCYSQLGKLCFAIKNCGISTLVLDQLYPVAIALNHNHMLSLFAKQGYSQPLFKHILLTRDADLIHAHLTLHPEDLSVTDLSIAKQVLELDDIVLVQRCTFHTPLRQLTVWATNHGLIEIAASLVTIGEQTKN